MLGKSVKDNVCLADNKTDEEVSEWAKQHTTTDNWFMGDAPEYDATQSIFTLILEGLAILMLTDDPELLAEYYSVRMNRKVFSQWFASVLDQNKPSGYPDTMTGNVILSMMIVILVMIEEEIRASSFKGDDSGVNTQSEVVALNNDIFKLIFDTEMKIMTKKHVFEFCNCLFGFGGYVYNPLILAEKINNKDMSIILATEENWLEYIDSLDSVMNSWRSKPFICIEIVMVWFELPREFVIKIFAVLDSFAQLTYQEALKLPFFKTILDDSEIRGWSNFEPPLSQKQLMQSHHVVSENITRAVVEQWCLSHALAAPIVNITSTGPPNNLLFTCTVQVAGRDFIASATTKKVAVAAAFQAVDLGALLPRVKSDTVQILSIEEVYAKVNLLTRTIKSGIDVNTALRILAVLGYKCLEMPEIFDVIGGKKGKNLKIPPPMKKAVTKVIKEVKAVEQEVRKGVKLVQHGGKRVNNKKAKGKIRASAGRGARTLTSNTVVEVAKLIAAACSIPRDIMGVRIPSTYTDTPTSLGHTSELIAPVVIPGSVTVLSFAISDNPLRAIMGVLENNAATVWIYKAMFSYPVGTTVVNANTYNPNGISTITYQGLPIVGWQFVSGLPLNGQFMPCGKGPGSLNQSNRFVFLNAGDLITLTPSALIDTYVMQIFYFNEGTYTTPFVAQGFTGSVAITQVVTNRGYYAIQVNCTGFTSAETGSLSVQFSNNLTAPWFTRMAPSIDTSVNQYNTLRFQGNAFRLENDASKLNDGGSITMVQPSGRIDISEFYQSANPYSYVTTIPNYVSNRIEEGAYTFVKPSDAKTFAMRRDLQCDPLSTIIEDCQYSIEEDTWVLIVANFMQVANKAYIIERSMNFEFTSSNKIFAAELADAPNSSMDMALDIIKHLPQYHTNPKHLAEIGAFIKRALGAAIKYGPMVAEVAGNLSKLFV